MSLIAQQIYSGQMKAQGYKLAYYLQECDSGEWGKIVHGPFEYSEGIIEKLKKLDTDNKLILGSCYIDDNGEIVG